MRDHDAKHDTADNHAHATHDAQQPAQRIHRVCVTCNNMFETDIEHIDAKHCPVCRRA